MRASNYIDCKRREKRELTAELFELAEEIQLDAGCNIDATGLKPDRPRRSASEVAFSIEGRVALLELFQRAENAIKYLDEVEP